MLSEIRSTSVAVVFSINDYFMMRQINPLSRENKFCYLTVIYSGSQDN